MFFALLIIALVVSYMITLPSAIRAASCSLHKDSEFSLGGALIRFVGLSFYAVMYTAWMVHIHQYALAWLTAVPIAMAFLIGIGRGIEEDVARRKQVAEEARVNQIRDEFFGPLIRK